MNLRLLLPVALATTLLLAGSASAAVVSAPVELGAGDFGLSATSATDAAGRTTAVLTGAGGGPKVLQREAGGTWSTPQPLPGSPRGVTGPVAAGAGQGVFALAWRIDSPRRYGGIGATIADPGQALSAPATLVGEDAGGTRHPALAVNAAGQALIAYNTGTRAVHLSLRGGIAIALRRAGGSFGPPVVVDPTPAVPPAVALAADGTGVVAWTRAQRLYVVSVDVTRGEIGPARRVSAPGGASEVVVAAAPGGAATLAWRDSVTTGPPRASRSSYDLLATRRRADGGFDAPRRLTRTRDFIRDLAIAADDEGATTVAWAQEHFGDDRSIGVNGVVSAIRMAYAAPGARAFAAARTLAPLGDEDCATPSLTARDGAVGLAWACLRRGRATLRVAVGPAGIGGAPTTADAVELGRRTTSGIRAVTVGLDDAARITAVYVRPDGPPPGQSFPSGAARVLSVTGR